jgi:hypothetical protein
VTIVVLFLAGIVSLFWLVSIVAVLTKPDGYRNGTQLIWVLVLLLSGPVGAVLYQCLGPDRQHSDEKPPPGRQARRDAIADPWSQASSR